MCLPLLLLFLTKMKNDLTWAGLKCRAPVHPATPQISGTSGREDHWLGWRALLASVVLVSLWCSASAPSPGQHR